MAPRPNDSPISNQRTNLFNPQVFVQLSFGLSWSDRHVPRSHTYSYTSKHLKTARDSGHFPRQLAQNKDYAQHAQRPASPQRNHRRQPSPQRRRRGRADSQPSSGSQRGSSAPPPVLPSGRWDDAADATAGPSATIFPRHPEQQHREQQRSGDPRHFRLGEDGLPWSAWAWPSDPASHDNEERELPFNNQPVTIPLSPPSHRRRTGGDDPQRTRDLESLSLAMMTVDNGFENQWWNQGGRESTVAWFPHQSPDDDEAAHRPLSAADAVLLSAAEPPSGVDAPVSTHSESIRGLVSPLSDLSSPSMQFAGHLQRSLSTRSDELWMDHAP